MAKYKFKKTGPDKGGELGKPEGNASQGESSGDKKPDLGGKGKGAAKAAKRYGKKEVRKGD